MVKKGGVLLERRRRKETWLLRRDTSIHGDIDARRAYDDTQSVSPPAAAHTIKGGGSVDGLSVPFRLSTNKHVQGELDLTHDQY